MTYATVEQVAVEIGRLPDSITPVERARWQQWLDRVERDITRGFARRGLVLGTQVAEGDPSMDAVADVEIAAVVRKIDNPSGDTRTTRTVSVDDGSVSNTHQKDGASTAIGLDLTDAEWERLLPDMVSEAFSTRPGFVSDRCGLPR